MKKNVLITGGAGFIGSNLYKLLSKNPKYHVELVDDLSSGVFSNIQDVSDEYFHWLSFDSEFITNRIKTKFYSYVIHLAAKPSVPYSIENIYDSHDVNVFKTLKLLEACKGNIEKFIFASSAAVYGKSFDLKWSLGIPETTSLQPLSPYALQKFEIEQYLNMMKNLFSFEFLTFRFFNVYGPNQYAGHPYANVISSWLHNIKHNLPIRIDGDGTQKRDFVFVEDVCNIIIYSLSNKFKSNEYNLGTGAIVSCNDVLKNLETEYKDVKKIYSPTRIGDIYEAKANIDLLESELKYKFIDFEDGIKNTIKWWNNGYK